MFVGGLLFTIFDPAKSLGVENCPGAKPIPCPSFGGRTSDIDKQIVRCSIPNPYQQVIEPFLADSPPKKFESPRCPFCSFGNQLLLWPDVKSRRRINISSHLTAVPMVHGQCEGYGEHEETSLLQLFKLSCGGGTMLNLHHDAGTGNISITRTRLRTDDAA